MRRLRVLVLLATACASTPEPTRQDALAAADRDLAGGGSATALAQQAAQMMAAQREATQACAALQQQAVSPEDQRLLGRKLTALRVARLGPVVLDVAAGVDPLEALRSRQKLTTSPKNRLVERVGELGRAVAKASKQPDLGWTFVVVKSDQVASTNAPDGTVLVTSALLRGLANEAQLAGVLAHEVAHVVSGDELQRFLKLREAQCQSARLANAMPQGATPEMKRLAAHFDRPGLALDDEPDSTLILELFEKFQSLESAHAHFDADLEAARMMAAAGYAVPEYARYLEGQPAEKHPAPAERSEKLQAALEREAATLGRGKAKADLAPLLAPLKE